VLTALVKSAYSLAVTAEGKLPYVPTLKKRERDPRKIERGNRIKEARTRANMSQEDVRKALGLGSREAVSNWERGDVGEIERSYRLGLCKLFGFEESELLLDTDDTRSEFDMPVSNDAKSVAYRWDDLPESLRVHIKQQMAAAERMLREDPRLAKRIYPEIDLPPKKPTKT